MPRGHYDRAAVRRPSIPQDPMTDSRPDVRQDPRPQMRAEDPRARAAERAAQILEHLGGGIEDVADKFYVDPDNVPDGWTYEWKRKEVLGKEDPAYAVSLARTGWEPVPASRHPSFMPEDWKGGTIEREGLVLMERPKAITERVKEIDRKRARMQVSQKEEQLSAAPAGQFGRAKSDGESLVKVKKSYEPMPIPQE